MYKLTAVYKKGQRKQIFVLRSTRKQIVNSLLLRTVYIKTPRRGLRISSDERHGHKSEQACHPFHHIHISREYDVRTVGPLKEYKFVIKQEKYSEQRKDVWIAQLTLSALEPAYVSETPARHSYALHEGPHLLK